LLCWSLLFLNSTQDSSKFRAAFKNKKSFTKEIHGQVVEWVANNLERWQEDNQPWFKIEMIDDDMLPPDVLQAQGGARRRRSAFGSVREIVGLEGDESGSNIVRVHPT